MSQFYGPIVNQLLSPEFRIRRTLHNDPDPRLSTAGS